MKAATEADARATARAQRPTEPSSPEDAALVEAARAGDRDAFSRLYRRHARLVHGLLLARVPVASADDLVQEVFVRAWDRLSDLRDPQAFVAWIAQMTRRMAADHVRRQRPTEPLREAVAVHDAPRAEAIAVIEAIRGLPEPYVEPLLLRLVEGMSGKEIAERTGLTPGSVRVNLHRGFRLLRERLQEDQG
jgi:RNA polymerase sigma-70 factor (ECF subfamily)